MELSAHGLSADVEPTVKIVARHSDTSSEELYALVAAVGVDGVELTHSGAPYIEMSAAGVSKASALQELCERWGISSGSVAAVGDARNDLPMLEWAGTALCPSDAADPVRAVADRVLESNDDDAVARYLEELTLRRSKL
jgi:HAD superfamily hydrolase (TIGR01484 family)